MTGKEIRRLFEAKLIEVSKRPGIGDPYISELAQEAWVLLWNAARSEAIDNAVKAVQWVAPQIHKTAKPAQVCATAVDAIRSVEAGGPPSVLVHITERSKAITDCLKLVNKEIDSCKSRGSKEVYAANRIWRAIDAMRATTKVVK